MYHEGLPEGPVVKTRVSVHRRGCGFDLLSGKLRSHMLCAWYRVQPKIKKKKKSYHENAGSVDKSEEISEKALNMQMDSVWRWFLSGTTALHRTQPWKRQRVHHGYSLLRRHDPKLELLDPYSKTRLNYLPSSNE